MLSMKNKKLANNIVLEAKEYIINLLKKSYISGEGLKDIALFFLITEDDVSEEIENILIKYFQYLKEDIEKYGIEEYGLIGGKGFDLFIVNFFRNKYGGMTTFYNKFENIIFKEANLHIQDLLENELVNPYDYDLIRGISGILYYFLVYNVDKDVSNFIKYLIYLTEDKIYKNMNVLNFHIEHDEDDNAFKNNGYINFSLSHGMLSPLICLVLAYKKGYEIRGLKESIDKLLYIYNIFEKESDGIIYWPTQLGIKDFYNKDWDLDKDPRNTKCMSWCYGSITISRILAKIYKILENEDKYMKYKHNFLKMINKDFNLYNLDNPNICHGYSSVINEIISFYKETGDELFIRRMDKLFEMSLDSFIDVNARIESKYTRNKHISIKDYDGCYKNLNFINGGLGYYITLNTLNDGDFEYSKLLLIDPV